MMDENSFESAVSEAAEENSTTELENVMAESDVPSDDEYYGGIDYAAVLDADMAELRAEFPELEELKDIYDLANPVRFGALRDLGLTAKEAYLASGGKRTVYDNRRHLTASVPRTARSSAGSSRCI